MNHEKLVQFIRRKCLVAGKPPTRFTLEHTSVDGSHTIVCEVIRKDDAEKDLEDEVSGIASELSEAALDHVESFTRLQRYVVIAHRKESKLGEHAVKLAPSPDGVSASESEPADSRGALAMMMRHADAAARLNHMSLAGIVEQYAGENERLRNRCEQLQDRLDKLFDEREEYRTRNHERQIELIEAEGSEKRKAELVAMAKPLVAAVAPTIINGLVGWFKAATAEKTSGADSDIMGLLETLTESQLGEIAAVLTPEQLERLAPIIAGSKLLEEKTESSDATERETTPEPRTVATEETTD